MPGGDRTGPMGQGPFTGRGSGYCRGFNSPGFTKGYEKGRGRESGRDYPFSYERGSRRGFHFGRGLNVLYPGSGFRRQWGAAPDSEGEIRFLRSEAEALKRSQKDIEKRLAELEKEE